MVSVVYFGSAVAAHVNWGKLSSDLMVGSLCVSDGGEGSWDFVSLSRPPHWPIQGIESMGFFVHLSVFYQLSP